MFYECLVGHPPFTGDTAEVLLARHLSEPVPLEPVPGPLRPLVAAGMAKDPGGRPADAAAFVAEIRAAASPAYGQDWEDRGRSHLEEAALLLAALWPSGAAPAAQGHAVEQVHLSESPWEPQDPEHARHLEHLRHLSTPSISNMSTSNTSSMSSTSSMPMPDSPASSRQASQAPALRQLHKAPSPPM
jgi:hypothetical protein